MLHFDSVGFDVITDEEVLHFDVLASIADLAVVGNVECNRMCFSCYVGFMCLRFGRLLWRLLRTLR